ncbi:MAG: hypothetical protein RL619_438 [Bacteroidota bacterium]|jgi:hypothetical protein
MKTQLKIKNVLRKKPHKNKKNSQVALRVLNIKYFNTYALLAAAIKFNAEPATNQPIWPSLYV